jgi:hypothetical protein
LRPIDEAEDLPLLAELGGDALGWALPGLASRVFGKMVFSEGLRLDGLVSVWHPDGQ